MKTHTNHFRNISSLIDSKILLIAMFSMLAVNFVNAQSSVETLRPQQIVVVKCTGPAPPYNAEIEGTFPIDQQGYVMLTHLGKVRVAGMTPIQAGNAIASMLISRGYYTKAQVTITQNWRLEGEAYFYIDGVVQSLGQKPLTPGMTVTDAIAAAGGLNIYAGSNPKITIYRKNQSQPIVVRYKDIKGNKANDVEIRSNDRIEVRKIGLLNGIFGGGE